jgi:hypothetical protein
VWLSNVTKASIAIYAVVASRHGLRGFGGAWMTMGSKLLRSGPYLRSRSSSRDLEFVR